MANTRLGALICEDSFLHCGKQKTGEKKMHEFDRVEIPQEAFIKALKIDS